jgi:hypothetical protein
VPLFGAIEVVPSTSNNEIANARRLGTIARMLSRTERLQSAVERLVLTVHVFGERRVLDGALRCVYKTLAEAKEYCTAFGMNLFNIAQWHGQVARVL